MDSPTRSTIIRLTIDRQKIAWLKFLLESYEGLALVSCFEPGSGRVVLSIGPGSESEVLGLLTAIGKEIGLIHGFSPDLAELMIDQAEE